MDPNHVSKATIITINNGARKDTEHITFSRRNPMQAPSASQLGKKVSRIELIINPYEKQQDVTRIYKAFKTDYTDHIQKLPRHFTYTVIEEGASVLKFGKMSVPSFMFDMAKKVGMTSYFDDSNFIICSSPEYSPFLNAIFKNFLPKQSSFGFRSNESLSLYI